MHFAVTVYYIIISKILEIRQNFKNDPIVKQDCPRTMAQLPTNLVRLITSTYYISINSIKFCRIKTNQLKL